MSEPEAKPTPDATPAREPQLVHVRMLEAERAEAAITAEEHRRRVVVFVALAALALSSAYSLYAIGDHPIRTLVASLGAALTFALGAVPALFRERPESADAWVRAALDAVVGRAAQTNRGTALLSGSLTILAVLAWVLGAHAVVDADFVACPAGVELAYGTLGARTACDGDDDTVWAPLGIEETARTFRCVATEGGASWRPFRRASHTDEASAAVRDPRFADDRFSCFEDGSLVVPSSDCAGHALVHLEYGWGTDRPDRPLPAPCDHEPPGVYRFDPEAHACAAIEASPCPLSCSPPVQDAPPPHVDASCEASCASALPALSRALAGTTAPGARAWLDGLGGGEVRLGYPVHRGVYKVSQLELVLEGRALAFPVGVSYRMTAGTRCVPPQDRRDGFLHVFQRDRETVLGYFEDAGGAHGFCVVETSFATAPPPAVASGCTRD